jgi:hypothetical protein
VTTIQINNNKILWCDENNELHRIGGPAVIEEHSVQWRRHGLLHRICGPAIERMYYHAPSAFNVVYTEYWLEGEKFDKQFFFAEIKKRLYRT